MSHFPFCRWQCLNCMHDGGALMSHVMSWLIMTMSCLSSGTKAQTKTVTFQKSLMSSELEHKHAIDLLCSKYSVLCVFPYQECIITFVFMQWFFFLIITCQCRRGHKCTCFPVSGFLSCKRCFGHCPQPLLGDCLIDEKNKELYCSFDFHSVGKVVTVLYISMVLLYKPHYNKIILFFLWYILIRF